ncbi:hypothetical protein KL930_001816 [Ogataea haglerorum]|uniref:CUE domain-containing protein n=1 Tax=Ogataea haglerorum TaxID=1937702 RepID=A0AAN6D9I6_9ASCO|nr:uncharacterized protein KL911_001757 [Ogataea haglerorum]KAG7698154.1 hypothetical protein KL915_001871 [Ogataea haglerorum]KAG7699552.1 hypothetical protein KL951_001269 [Ogataea haglerorum]KAG7708375.1 hypothetical protein KL914_002101 [Ogataea haglerorum]KAG7710597.1 hypothetical protein KL950_001510 [Ogataea haglerorum]KAG7721218.1 hypothetical protein KL913_000954 [Ogataea haglerorum]
MNSTITLVVTLVVAFVFIAYFLGDDAGVTDEMVARVAQIAPHLPPSVIRRDLERTRSVHVTIDNYLNGLLAAHETGESQCIGSQPIKKQDRKPAQFEGLDFEQKKREMVLRARQRLNLG